MAYKCMKKGSISLETEILQIKTTITYYYMFNRLSNVLKFDETINRCTFIGNSLALSNDFKDIHTL